ncbi:hypothetical protein JG688_00005891 [Phytophthora aleatoria]|uniref:DDE-1 domain-containing protein n=1 Tax=Phytophthora aleatoria TaxID=2496075 RepID=A0A8J5J920_9STRA|nr:hypothetical protein JG688_00005891 [Phytophthora aleatoria]
MRLYGLSLRRTMNLTVLTDDVLTDRAMRDSFLSYLSEHMTDISEDHTVLMDETAIYFEDPRRQTVDQVGARHVVLKSRGFASMRVTAELAVTGAGRKLSPLVVWKGAKQDGHIARYGNVYVDHQPKAWVNSALLTHWLDLVFPPIFDTCTQCTALVWDSLRAHISKMVTARCAAKDVQMFVIPGGLTPYVQAGDIGIYKSFKYKLAPIIDSWKKSDAMMYTRGGNPKSPTVETVAN